MYKIMLAEDEPEVLSAILDTIRWEAFSFHRPLGCRDGRDAMAALEEGYIPDVIITDICMPFVDGLALARYAADRCPKTIVVILSGYSEFSYAQQAVQLQVYDYVLKPITPASIQKLLQRLKEELDNRRLHDIDDSLHILRGHFLNRLTTKRLDELVVDENVERHKLRFPGRHHLAMVLDVDAPLNAKSDVQEGNALELARYGLFNIASELVERHAAQGGRAGGQAGDEAPGNAVQFDEDQILTFQAQDGATKMIVSADGEADCQDIAVYMASVVAETVKRYLSTTVSAGIGEPVARLGGLYKSHQQAVKALAHRFFYGEQSILSSRDINDKEGSDSDVSVYYQSFEDALKACSRTKTDKVTAALFTYLGENHWPIERCVFCCQKLLFLLHEFVSQFGGEAEIKMLESIWEQMSFESASTIMQLQEMIHTLSGQILDIFGDLQTDSAVAQVRRAESYIRDHYNEPGLSLHVITEHLALSISYFSAIFKSHTGCTFVEYLTRVRMDRAKQILALTDRRTYETAYDVGYSDPNYFSVAFKRFTGMSPREFREYSQGQVEYEVV